GAVAFGTAVGGGGALAAVPVSGTGGVACGDSGVMGCAATGFLTAVAGPDGSTLGVSSSCFVFAGVGDVVSVACAGSGGTGACSRGGRAGGVSTSPVASDDDATGCLPVVFG